MDESSDTDLGDRFLPRLRDELAALRSASAETADARKPVELDQQSVGRLSRMDALRDIHRRDPPKRSKGCTVSSILTKD